MNDSKLQKHIRDFPNKPGVYLMKDGDGVILYIGKAVDLKKRVSSYFRRNKDPKTRVLVPQIDDIDHITTHSEFEALLLENTLIKKWKPRYNINLKDGKSYPVIRITNEAFPRVFRTRRIIEDGSEYYGPYPNVHALDKYLEVIEKHFPLRKCRGPLKKREFPCFYYHIHRCAAPCVGKVSREEYQENVDRIRTLLSGSTTELIEDLKGKMNEAVADLRFEAAAEYRDAIAAVEEIASEQEVVDFNQDTRDYIAVAEREGGCCFAVFQMRTGKLVGRELYRSDHCADVEDSFHQFVLQYYADDEVLPERLYVQAPANVQLISQYFSEERGADTVVEIPSDSRNASILKLARDNAFEDLLKGNGRTVSGLEELRIALELEKVPVRIEGFDISHLSGKHTVASMVSFKNGTPDKENYRRFHIRGLNGKVDDYEAMREVIARRYTRVMNERMDAPDLVLVDGGRGQVRAASEILSALGLESVPLAGLAKREEEIFLPRRSDPLRLPQSSDALKILQRVRDESHRFATSFNTQLRKKDVKLTILEEIPGIGPKRAAAITRSLGSLEDIATASPEKIAEVAGVTSEKAEEIVRHIRHVTIKTK